MWEAVEQREKWGKGGGPVEQRGCKGEVENEEGEESGRWEEGGRRGSYLSHCVGTQFGGKEFINFVFHFIIKVEELHVATSHTTPEGGRYWKGKREGREEEKEGNRKYGKEGWTK